MISDRLKTVAEMTTRGNIVADIGTDHGYVPIYLVENQICEKVYAMDINDGPLKIADKNIAMKELESNIETIKSDGMEKLKDNMVQTVIIAGVGGELMVNILKKGENIKGIKEFVLCPHRRVDMVREYLLDKNWKIIDEKMLIDDGKYYTVMKAKKGCEKISYDETEIKYGRILLKNKDNILKKYLEKEYSKFYDILNTMKKSNSENISRIEQVIYLNREAYKVYD